MTPYFQQMTAAMLLPQAIAAETMATLTSLWARRATEAFAQWGPDDGGAELLPVPTRDASASATATFDPTAGPAGPLPG